MRSWFPPFLRNSVPPRSLRAFTAAAGFFFLAAGLSSGWAQSVSPACAPVAKAGVLLPAIEGKTIDGKPFQLSMLKGKVVLIMFWSTECAVCRDKMPELRKLRGLERQAVRVGCGKY